MAKSRCPGVYCTARSLRKAATDTHGFALRSFVAFLNGLPRPETPPVFVDIGSGTGKAVLAAALAMPLSAAVGVELVPKLHECATEAHCRLVLALREQPDSALQATLDATGMLGSGRRELVDWVGGNIHLRCGDSFRGDKAGSLPGWVRDVTAKSRPQPLVWLYAPCAVFTAEMMASLSLWAQKLRPGSIVITTTQKLPPLRMGPDAAADRNPRRKTSSSSPSSTRCGRLHLAQTLRVSYDRGKLAFYVYHVMPDKQD